MRSEAHDRPGLTPKGERTRGRIVDAAARLIYERGVAGTTLEDIRSAAGVSGSQLSHYFAGKDELVQAVIDHQAETITGNQRQADLSSPGGLRAWRNMVIAQVQRDRRAGPRLDRSRIRAVVGRDQRRAAPSSRRRAPARRHRPGRPGRHPPRRTPRRPPPSNRVVPSSWQKTPQGGPMLMAGDTFTPKHNRSPDGPLAHRTGSSA
jgi:AcrR family transcriptional regulator